MYAVEILLIHVLPKERCISMHNRANRAQQFIVWHSNFMYTFIYVLPNESCLSVRKHVLSPKFHPGLAASQDTDLSEGENSFESEFHIKYHNKDDEKKAGERHLPWTWLKSFIFIHFAMLRSEVLVILYEILGGVELCSTEVAFLLPAQQPRVQITAQQWIFSHLCCLVCE